MTIAPPISPAPDRDAELAELATVIPDEIPSRLRVLCLVALSAIRLRYAPLLREVADALGLARSTVTHHVSLLDGDGMIVHPNGAQRCAVTVKGRQRVLDLLGESR